LLGLATRLKIDVGFCCAVMAFAFAVGTVANYADKTGLFARPEALAAAQEAHAGSFIPKISIARVEKEMQSGKTAIVDARFSKDFESGHLPGALSLPISATEEEAAKIVPKLPKEGSIILYCRSSKCPYAERTAVKLSGIGFTNLLVYKGGWLDWVAKHPDKQGAKEGPSS
jgi:rhodanese-related sulfurtransferase